VMRAHGHVGGGVPRSRAGRRGGCVENLTQYPLPFEANAWRLTPSGIELAGAITDDAKATARTSHTTRTTTPTKEQQ
jgi:hypothetical protein